MAEDPTRFVERGFTWVENKEHSVRLIDRNNSNQAISIAWADLPSLHELIVLALGDDKLKHTTTPPDFTEQARQLVDELCNHATTLTPTVNGDAISAGYSANYLIEKLTALAAEAATAALEQERERILDAIIAIPITRPVEDFAEARDVWDYKADVLAAIGDDREQQR